NYDMKLLPNLYQNRVVLVGDAAHPMGSIMGLNANLALEDARSLSLHLHNEKNIELALTKYSLEQIQKIIPIIALEENRKKFFVNMTNEIYTEFENFIKSASAVDFFKPLLTVISPTIYHASTSFIQLVLNLSNVSALKKE